MIGLIEITKPAFNKEWRTIQFRRPDGQGQLNESETITSVEIQCVDQSGVLIGDMVSQSGVYSGTQVRYRLEGGVPGMSYCLYFRIITSNGQNLEERARLNII